MPTRRLVVALTILLVGVFGVGLVTALSRVGDDKDTGAQGPTPTPTVTTPPFTMEPTPTDQPEPTGSPTPEPTVAPTGAATSPPAGGDGGNGGAPRMPNTGLPMAVAATGALTLATATAIRRLAQ